MHKKQTHIECNNKHPHILNEGVYYDTIIVPENTDSYVVPEDIA